VNRLTAAIPAELIAASTRARTLTVRAVPWGVVGRTSLGATRFVRGSVAVPEELSRVKFLAEHRLPGHPEPAVAGYAVHAADTGSALEVAIVIPPTEAGDRALAEAAHRLRDGVSVEVSGLIAARDPDGVLEVAGSYLEAIAQVAVPAFAPARVLTLNP
jgi:hypothetical protein